MPLDEDDLEDEAVVAGEKPRVRAVAQRPLAGEIGDEKRLKGGVDTAGVARPVR